MGFGLYRKRFINDKRSTAENDHKAEKEKKMEKTTEIFTKTKVLDIDTFETIKDKKTFDSEGNRIGFVRTVIYQDYSGETSVSKEVIQ